MAKQLKTKNIKVLSIRQPHADHVIFGTKWCENRTWRTRYRGELFIHASRWDGPSDQETPGNGEVGSIIGSVQLVDVVGDSHQGVTDAEVRRMARSHGLSTRRGCMEHVSGPVCWILTEAKPLKESVPCKGQLGVFTRAVPSNLLNFGRPGKKVWTRRRQRREQRIRVGSRVNERRRNYYVVEIDDNLVAIARRRNGSAEEWLDVCELELGWHRY
jgi:hypothetical protein